MTSGADTTTGVTLTQMKSTITASTLNTSSSGGDIDAWVVSLGGFGAGVTLADVTSATGNGWTSADYATASSSSGWTLISADATHHNPIHGRPSHGISAVAARVMPPASKPAARISITALSPPKTSSRFGRATATGPGTRASVQTSGRSVRTIISAISARAIPALAPVPPRLKRKPRTWTGDCITVSARGIRQAHGQVARASVALNLSAENLSAEDLPAKWA